MSLSKIFVVALVIGISGCASKYEGECTIPPTFKNAATTATPPASTGNAILKVTQATQADTWGVTKVLVDKKLVCELQASKDCSVEIGTGCQAVTLNHALDPGTFSRMYLFEDGKTYQFEVDTEWGVAITNAVAAPIPLGAMLGAKGGSAQIVLKLMSVKKSENN
jgi:hypothetical protein